MSRIYINSCGPSDWRAKLASPDRHWKRGRSAFELAVSWERASHSSGGIPLEVAKVFTSEPRLAGPRLLFGVVEHKVTLPGGSRPSQNDLWALVVSSSGVVSSIAVEGKAGEPFDRTVEEWLADSKDGSRKAERLEKLTTMLGMENFFPGPIRYQLIHRTASALIEAKRFRTSAAVMIVQSFKPDRDSESDFRAFTRLLGAEVGPGEVREVRQIDGRPLFVGWVSSLLASDREVADSLGALA